MSATIRITVSATTRLEDLPRVSRGRVLPTAMSCIKDALLSRDVDPAFALPLAVRGKGGRLPTSLDLPRYCDLMQRAARQSGNDSFGLECGRDLMRERLGLVGDIVLSSPTVGSALENLVGCFPFHQQNTAIAFRRTAGLCRLEYRILDGGIIDRRQEAELTISSLLRLLRECLGGDWRPDEVHFEHPRPERIQAHRQILAAPVYFAMATNALLFREPDLSHPLRGGNPGRVDTLRRNLVELADDTAALSLTDEVAGEIRFRLAGGYPHIENVADALRMTRWTLQRRLAEHDVTFSDLVERVRRGLADLHLGAAHMPIREIADLLGYSELSAFTRASVRWFGAPPSKVRERILKGTVTDLGECNEKSIGRPRGDLGFVRAQTDGTRR